VYLLSSVLRFFLRGVSCKKSLEKIYISADRFGSLCGVEWEAGLNNAAAAKEQGIFPVK
jgi:hypothetical protein